MPLEGVLTFADQVLQGSTRLQFRSLLQDLGAESFPLTVRGRAYIVGEVLHCQGNEIGLKPLAFAPGKGFHESDSTRELVTISIPMLASRSIPIRPGVRLYAVDL